MCVCVSQKFSADVFNTVVEAVKSDESMTGKSDKEVCVCVCHTL